MTTKYLYTTIVTFFILLLSASFCNAQKWKVELFKNDTVLAIPTIVMPKTNNDSLRNYYDKQGKNRPYVIANLFPQNIQTNTNGLWVKNSDNSYSWFCRIQSKTAFSLNFVLEHITFDSNAQLYIINTVSKIASGPFTNKNKNEDSTLYTEQIPGETVIFELDIPAQSSISKSYFTISKVGHDFRDFYASQSATRSSGS